VGDNEKGGQRPYRKPKTVPEAIAELQRGAGTQFHPEVVRAFLDALAAGDFGVEHAEHAILVMAQKQAVA
jgi:HD-GYP domain-containing protein (c-di-GMP phosphodiesterase class II)